MDLVVYDTPSSYAGTRNPAWYQVGVDLDLESLSSVNLLNPEPLLDGVYAFNGPQAQSTYLTTGEYRPGMDYYFYNRYAVSPGDLALGNLASEQTYEITIWNGFFEPKDLASLTSVGSDGINLVGTFPIPGTLKPLEVITYQVTVTLNGPPNIAATYTWDFEGEDVQLNITGSRAVLAAFPPNWNNPVKEALEWSTSILRAESGKEQRAGRAEKPMRRFTYSFTTLTPEETSRLEYAAFGWRGRSYAVPIWPEVTRLVTMSVNRDVLNVEDATDRSFVEGGLIAIGEKSDLDTAEVIAIDGNQLTLRAPLARVWGQGAKVYPATVGVMDTAQIDRETDYHAKGTLSFRVDPVRGEVNLPSTAAPTTYKGREVVTLRPDWSEPPKQQILADYQDLDFGFGAFFRDLSSESADWIRNMHYLITGKDSIAEFRATLRRLWGMKNAVYVPTWTSDFRVIGTTSLSDTIISVEKNTGDRFIADSEIDAIRIETVDAVYYRDIPSISVTEDSLGLFIQDPLGVTYSKEAIRKISLLMKCRLNTDLVEIDWVTNDKLRVTLPWTQVRDDL